MSFVIDTIGNRDSSSNKFETGHADEDSEDDFTFIPLKTSMTTPGRCSNNESEYDDIDLRNIVSRQRSKQDDILKNSVIPPGVEKLTSLPSYDEGKRQVLRKRKMEREQTAGSKWFNIKAPEMTEEIRNDLDVLKMRSALDPKSFKKRNDLKVLPKHFQIGRVVGSSADFYSSRIPKKEQKKTLVEELLADAEFQRNTKKKLKKIIMSKK